MDGVVAQHGVEWLGFSAVRRVLRALHTPVHTLDVEDGAVDAEKRAQVLSVDTRSRAQALSVELWDVSSGQLVSGEVGLLSGGCYTCLSLFSNTKNFPRCDRVRMHAAMRFLHRAGIYLFDAGATSTSQDENTCICSGRDVGDIRE
eukprot:m.122670 g.122670  ORF g.122670 m.122670 type:complete len:146 (-) comp16572_c0_seq2:357-794(-)